jgi:hypothetical protein
LNYYSAKRLAITLSQLGLQTYVTPWNGLNRALNRARLTARLLFPGWSAWTNYKYSTVGQFWYKESAPGVPADPTLTAGMGIVFLRYGPPDATDQLPEAPWYLHPPNDW